MGVLNPEPRASTVLLPRAALAGVALGAAGMAGASLVLYDAAGLLAGSTGMVSTLLAALLMGIWAGSPLEEELPYRERWVGAGVAVAFAGAFATYVTLYGPLEGALLGRVVALIALVALPAYMLGLLLPVLLVWSEGWDDPDADGEQGEWGALGALVAGVLGGALVGVLLSGLLLVSWLGPGALLLATSVALLAPAVLPEPDRPAAHEQQLHEVSTPFSHLRVTEVVFPGERQPERRLYLNDEQESGELVRSGAPTLAYIAAAESWLTGATPVGSSFLFLGGGAYTLPRRIAERDARARITVVELDPEVTRLAYRFFGLRRDHGINSVHGDARAFVESPEAGEYDRIYLDVYSGHESLPYSLVTVEAFSALRRHLRPGGVVAMNVIGVTSGPEATRLWSVVHTMGQVFPALALYTHLGPEYPERQNVLLAGAPDPEHVFPERAGLFDPWPHERWPDWEGTAVFHDLWPGSTGRAATPRASSA